jgi:subtilisin family serine protease
LSARTLTIALLAYMCASTCLALDRGGDSQPGVDDIERQLLVMLRMPAPHFRPDIDYGGSYDSRTGRDARRRIAQALASRYGLKLVDQWPMPALGVDCIVMEAPPGASLPGIAEQLSRDARVESAQSMSLFRVLANNDPLYPLQPVAKSWHLADMHRIATGKRVRVAEIDTMVEADHPDLSGQVALTRDFVNAPAVVDELHGTAVAGIIAARANNGVGITGVAPEAQLLALRACWQTRSRDGAAVCSTFTLAKALQFAIDERVQVINLSVGGPHDPLIGRLIDAASARGITVVGASDPRLGDGGFPASHRGVLAIGAEDGHDSPAAVLRAPGRDIPTTVVGRQWGFVTGSSYAAAHVSGLVALLYELAPRLGPQKVREALAAGRRMGQPSIVDACAAVAKTAGTCACECGQTRHTLSSSP